MANPALTTTVTKGSGNLAHNLRTKEIDKALYDNKTPQNTIYKKQSLKMAYREIFGDAVKIHDESQEQANHKERAYGSADAYLNAIKKRNNKQKPFYELVIEVGNIEDVPHGSNLEKLTDEILDEYMKTFEQRNTTKDGQGFKVFQAVLHRDEEGVNHLHIDFIPVATAKRGKMPLTNSYNKAFKALGFTGRSTFQDWQTTEINVLKRLMAERGIDHKKAQPRENGKKQLSTAEYRQYKQLQNKIKDKKQELSALDAQLKQKTEQIELVNHAHLRTEKKGLVNKVNVISDEEIERGNEMAKWYYRHNPTAQAKKRLENEPNEYIETVQKLKQENHQLQEQVSELSQNFQKELTQSQEYRVLEHSNKLLEQSNNNLNEKNKLLKLQLGQSEERLSVYEKFLKLCKPLMEPIFNSLMKYSKKQSVQESAEEILENYSMDNPCNVVYDFMETIDIKEQEQGNETLDILNYLEDLQR